MMVSPSGIPHAPYPPCSNTKDVPEEEIRIFFLFLYFTAHPMYPRAKSRQKDLLSSLPLQGEATSWDTLAASTPCERIWPPCDHLHCYQNFHRNYLCCTYVVSNAPHSVEVSPRTFPCSPRDASVQGEKLTRVRIKISASTYNKPSSWEEGETVIKSRLKQVRDRAGWGID